MEKDDTKVNLWNKMGDFPSHRSHHCSVIWNTYIITFGGYNGSRYLNDILAFGTKTNKWLTITPTNAVPLSRANNSMCLVSDKVIIFGGEDSKGQIMNEIGLIKLKVSGEVNFSKKTEISAEWEVIENKGETTLYRTCHSANIYQNKMYVFGGFNQQKEDNNELWNLDLDTYNWSQCETSGDLPGKFILETINEYLDRRYIYASVLYQDKMYLFGGSSKTLRKILNDMHVLDLQALKWKKLNPTGTVPSPRNCVSAQEREGEIYFFGGKDEKTCFNDFFVYIIEEDNWKQINTYQTPAPRALHSSVCFENYLFILGGKNLYDSNKFYSDIYSIRIEKTKGTLRPSIETSIIKDSFLDITYADVVFKVENQNFPAHKLIVAKRCKYFDNLFQSIFELHSLSNSWLKGGMSESNSKEISFSDIKANTFKAILGFIYGHDITEVDEDFAIELFGLSDKYLLSDLKQEIESLLSRSLEINNFVKLANLSESYGGNILKEAVLDFVIKNYDTVKDRDDLYDLPKSTLVQMFQRKGPK